MTDLADIFVELGLSQYLDTFCEHGFDTWDTILDITESDFDALGVKLGHRRRLQRKIANSRGLSSDLALVSPGSTFTAVNDQTESAGGTPKPESIARDNGTATHTGKRKYRRHPKADVNAPERPPSAYVIFSNKMREDLKGRNLSFTEIAKLVGENWQSLPAGEKEIYEGQAFVAKEKYNEELAAYKKTDQWRQFAEYLVEFKAKYASQQQTNPEVTHDATKRPKLHNHNLSAGSSGTDTGSELPSAGGRPRHQSFGSSRFGNDLSSAMENAQPNAGPVKLDGLDPKGANSNSSANLPGYRDSMFRSQNTLAWRENTHASESPSALTQSQYPRIMTREETISGSGPLMNHVTDSNLTRGFTPPSLTSESTTASNSSSLYYGPRTPIEPSLGVSLPVPAVFTSKPAGAYELPPIRPPSLSPQTSMHLPYKTPLAIPDYGPPRRGYVPLSDQSRNTFDDGPLDPVAALLRAGEIVDRNTQSHQQQNLPSNPPSR
jgi:hypothetical protein